MRLFRFLAAALLPVLAFAQQPVTLQRTSATDPSPNRLTSTSKTLIVPTGGSISADAGGAIISTGGTASTMPWAGLTAIPAPTFTGSGDAALSITLLPNATATGSITFSNVNSNVGTFAGLTVNAKGQVTGASALTIATTAPLTGGGTLGNLTLSIPQATASVNGFLSSTDWATFNAKQPAGSYITGLTGDGTASGPGSAVFILTAVTTSGSIGNSAAIPTITYDAKGRIIGTGTASITAPAGALTGTTLAANVTGSSLTSVGTLIGGATGAGFTVNLGSSTITGALGVTNGGNGLATAALGDLRYGSGTNTLAALAGNTTATKKYLSQTGTGTVSAAPAWAQVAAADISGLAASATTDTTNASNISSGTLPAGRLPNPTASTLGGIQSAAAVAHQWVSAISTLGVPALSQPAFADISGTLGVAQGGTGAGTFTANAILTGNGTAALQATGASMAASGNLLTFAGASTFGDSGFGVQTFTTSVATNQALWNFANSNLAHSVVIGGSTSNGTIGVISLSGTTTAASIVGIMNGASGGGLNLTTITGTAIRFDIANSPVGSIGATSLSLLQATAGTSTSTGALIVNNQFSVSGSQGNVYTNGAINLTGSTSAITSTGSGGTASPLSFTTNAGTYSPSSNGVLGQFSGGSFTNNVTAANGTTPSAYGYAFSTPQFYATNTLVTTTDIATLYVPAATTGTNMTATNAYAAIFGGNALFGSSSTTTPQNGWISLSGGNVADAVIGMRAQSIARIWSVKAASSTGTFSITDTTDSESAFTMDINANVTLGTTGSGGGVTINSTKSGASTSVAAILGKSAGLTENLWVGGTGNFAGVVTVGAPIVHKTYTVAALPAAAAGNNAGVVFVSDATAAAGTSIGSAPTGGGSVVRAVYSNGSAWLLL